MEGIVTVSAGLVVVVLSIWAGPLALALGLACCALGIGLVWVGLS